MIRQLTVDFNRVVSNDLIRGNARRAVAGTIPPAMRLTTWSRTSWSVSESSFVEASRSTVSRSVWSPGSARRRAISPNTISSTTLVARIALRNGGRRPVDGLTRPMRTWSQAS